MDYILKDSLTVQYIQTPLKNKTIEKIFLSTGVKRISIYNNSIDFGFQGTGRDYYCGVVWTNDGNPVGFQGEQTILVVNGTGWEYKEKDGDDRYYTEKIINNWYFYEASF